MVVITFGYEIRFAQIVDVGEDLDACASGCAVCEAEAVAYCERLAVHDARSDCVRVHHDAHVRPVLDDLLLKMT